MHYLYGLRPCPACDSFGRITQPDGTYLYCALCGGSGEVSVTDEGMDETGPDALPRDDD